MGTCCFTPKKTDFLWWYWLLLASVVGFPMYLAARHVARGDESDEEDKTRRGKKAGRIFWGATVVSVALAATVGVLLIGLLARSDGRSNSHATTAGVLVFNYVGCLILANLALALVRKTKRTLARTAIVAAFLLAWVGVSSFTWLMNPLQWLRIPWVILEPIYPVPVCLMFAVALAPAYRWRSFLAQPGKRTARRALASVLISAILFYAVARYGQAAHFHAYSLARGNWPSAAEAEPYRTR